MPLPEREDLDSIEVPLRDGRVVEYGPPTGISLSERIARMFAPRSAAEGGPDPGITEYRLSNGLRVLLFPDQTKPTVLQYRGHSEPRTNRHCRSRADQT